MQETLDQTALTAEPGELVLCVPAGWESYISLEFYELHQGLVAHGWTKLVIDEMEDAALVTAIQRARARAALLWEAYELLERNAAALNPTNAGPPRRIVFCDDVHYFTSARRQQRLRAFDWADLILSTYPDKLRQWFPEVAAQKIHWSPHAAATCFRPAAMPSSNRVLLSGSRSWAYPFRQFCQAKLPGSVCEVVDHPGYPGYPGDRVNAARADPQAFQQRAREQYAALLNSHPAMLVCGSIFGYLVAKVFEGMASRCLVIAERSSLAQRLALLGFIEGEHYVGTDLSHLIEDTVKVRDAFLRGDPNWARMADNAARKVNAQHTTAVRAAEIHRYCNQGARA